MSDICIKAENISKYFYVLKAQRTMFRILKAWVKREPIREKYWVLRDISFTIKRGEKVAIIGSNGSGKTTLLRILTGIYDQSGGFFEVGPVPCALFRSWTGLNAALSAIDNAYLLGALYGMDRRFLKGRMDSIIDMAELDILKFSSMNELSLGQIQRLALSVFFQTTSDLLIFDESLAFVDHSFAKKCEAYFQNLYSSDKTALITSHDTYFLKRWCKTAIWIERGHICMHGAAGDVIDEYERCLQA